MFAEEILPLPTSSPDQNKHERLTNMNTHEQNKVYISWVFRNTAKFHGSSNVLDK